MVYTHRPETILYMLGFLSFLMIFVIDSLSAYMYIYIYIHLNALWAQFKPPQRKTCLKHSLLALTLPKANDVEKG